MMQPNNGIFISTWYDDPQDTALYELIPLLEELITTRARVPDILNKYREQIPGWAGFGRWDLGDSGLDMQPQLEMPQQVQQPEPAPIQRQAPAPAPSPAQRQAPAPVEQAQAKVLSQGAQQPQQTYQSGPATGQYQQQSAGGTAANGNNGYPQDQQQQQPWVQQSTQVQQPVRPPPVQQQRPVSSAYAGVAGPYQAHQSVPQSQGQPRAAFGGIAGPYQASQSRPGHA